MIRSDFIDNSTKRGELRILGTIRIRAEVWVRKVMVRLWLDLSEAQPSTFHASKMHWSTVTER